MMDITYHDSALDPDSFRKWWVSNNTNLCSRRTTQTCSAEYSNIGIHLEMFLISLSYWLRPIQTFQSDEELQPKLIVLHRFIQWTTRLARLTPAWVSMHHTDVSHLFWLPPRQFPSYARLPLPFAHPVPQVVLVLNRHKTNIPITYQTKKSAKYGTFSTVHFLELKCQVPLVSSCPGLRIQYGVREAGARPKGCEEEVHQWFGKGRLSGGGQCIVFHDFMKFV